MNTQPILIDKRLVPSLRFPKEPLRIERQRRINLAFMLEVGVKLGNSYKNKIRITFVDSEGRKMVETSVWQATNNYIVLKGSIIIPFNRVEDVQLY